MITAQWKGLKEAETAIRSLGDAFAQPVLERAVKRAAEPFRDGIVRGLERHRQTGLTADDVRIVISKGARDFGRVIGLVGARVTKSGRAYILRFLEYGTARQRPTPIVRPAYDAEAAGSEELLLEELKSSTDAHLRKFAAKAGRAA